MEPLLTIDEAAQVLRIKKSTLYTWENAKGQALMNLTFFAVSSAE